MDDIASETLANRLLDARRTRRAIPLDAIGAVPADTGAAYRIQARVTAATGAVGAWKTGRSTPDAPQILAPILADTVRPSPARFAADELVLIGVELEVAFRVEASLPPADAPDFAEAARERVSVLAAIEVVDSRLADPEAADPLLKLADNQLSGGLVVGVPRRDWQGLDLAQVEAELWLGGERVVQGPAAVPGGDAFATFCAFARLVGDHCGGLRPGQFVTTGTLTGLRFVARGTPVRGAIAGLGEVTADFPV